MNKTFIVVSIFCISFTCWWAWKLDSGPFIYRHPVPEKLSQQIKEEFLPYFKGRDISKIRFGRKNAHPSEKVPVVVIADNEEEWLIQNVNAGPVLLQVDLEGSGVTIYWDVPEDMPFDQSRSLLSQSLWDVLIQYDQIKKVQSSYE
ncbi:MAG: hypothetical protein G8D91_15950 [gamma proteobacterium symbiont of Clathrolucina costata]